MAIIGGGISAELLCWHLAKDQLLQEHYQFVQIYHDELAPNCSRSSTAIASTWGVNPLYGAKAKMVELAYREFQGFVARYSPKGIDQCSHFICSQNNTQDYQKVVKRYGDVLTTNQFKLFSTEENILSYEREAYLIDPNEFLSWLVDTRAKKIERIEDLVCSVNENNQKVVLNLKNSGLRSFDEVILCTGAGTKFIGGVDHENDVEKSKSVMGSYLSFKNFEYSQSFFIEFNGGQCLYRKMQSELILGTTTQKEIYFVKGRGIEKLISIYELFKNNFNFNFIFPQLQDAVIKTGPRHLGYKREVFCGKIMKQTWGLWGFYKNGYTFPFVYIPRLVEMIKNDL